MQCHGRDWSTWTWPMSGCSATVTSHGCSGSDPGVPGVGLHHQCGAHTWPAWQCQTWAVVTSQWPPWTPWGQRWWWWGWAVSWCWGWCSPWPPSAVSADTDWPTVRPPCPVQSQLTRWHNQHPLQVQVKIFYHRTPTTTVSTSANSKATLRQTPALKVRFPAASLASKIGAMITSCVSSLCSLNTEDAFGQLKPLCIEATPL